MAPPWCHMSSYWKSTLTIWPNMKAKDKISIFKLLSELEKFWKCNLGFSKIPISHLFYELGKNLDICTAPNQHFKIQMLNLWMSWENICPKLRFSDENKMENSHKRGWSHFKFNINDWDIPFPKILRIYQWNWKIFFPWGNIMNPFSWKGNVLDWRWKYRP